MRTRDTAVKGLLALAAAAIGFAAADTYVVVLALPEMMTSSGLGIDELQRAAPIISGFLLGYVAILPLIGRISDVRGRVPVLMACLVIFSIGSLVTAAGHDLSTIVVGRFIQGVGGGGLIPPTLALIADVWPPERRGLPLGVVGAVQELGAVIGPLYGAVILAWGSWRDIFWLNLGVGLLIAAALLAFRDADELHLPDERPRVPDPWGLVLFGVLGLGLALILSPPAFLTSGVTSGLAFLPLLGDTAWTSGVAVAFGLALVAFIVRLFIAEHPLINPRGVLLVAQQIDLLGALALTVSLGAIVLTFATADHESAAISPDAWFLLPVAIVASILFISRQRTAQNPLITRGALKERAAWGAVAISFFIGSALIAALVDIPFFARLTTERNSQVGAAMVLVRFLIALPVGALLGGWLLRRFSAAMITFVAMLMSAGAFGVMSTWQADALTHVTAQVVLVVCGLGFGLAIAPVNDALLAATADAVHGLASALLIVARMVGMLIGISVLTTLGVETFRRKVAQLPTVEELCNGQQTACAAYGAAMRDAGIVQLQAVFLGAMVCALIAAALAAVLLRRPATLKA